MFSALLVALTTAGALWTLAVTASPAVRWEAPALCPGAAQGQAMIEANLGVALNEIETNADFAVTFSKGSQGWSAIIDMRSSASNSTRTLPAVDSCREASEAAALVVAIALQPSTAAPQKASGPEPEPEPELVPEPEPEPKLVPEPGSVPGRAPEPEPELVPQPEPERVPAAQPEPAPLRSPAPTPVRLTVGGHLGIAGGVRYGSLDQAVGVLNLRGGLLLRRARVSLEAVVAPQRVVAVDNAAQVRFTQWGIAAGGCWRIPLAESISLEPCGGMEVGQMVSTPEGLEDRATRAPTWLAVRAGPHVNWRFLPRAGLWAGAEALVPLARPAYKVGGVGTVARTLPVGVSGFAGVEIRLGKPL